ARAPTDVGLARIAFGQRFFLGRAGVDQRQGHVGLALLDVDAAGDRTQRATPAAEVAEHAADRRPGAAAARILVGRNDVRLEEIVRRLDLALAHVRAALQLTVVGERALHRAAVHRPVAVDHAEATRLRDEHLDDRLGAAEVQFAPPFLVGRNDGERADA